MQRHCCFTAHVEEIGKNLIFKGHYGNRGFGEAWSKGLENRRQELADRRQKVKTATSFFFLLDSGYLS
jgi:hypothetical protein